MEHGIRGLKLIGLFQIKEEAALGLSPTRQENKRLKQVKPLRVIEIVIISMLCGVLAHAANQKQMRRYDDLSG